MKTIDSPKFSTTDEVPAGECDLRKNEMITKEVLKPIFFQTLKLEGTSIIEPEEVQSPVHSSKCMKINRNKRYEY